VADILIRNAQLALTMDDAERELRDVDILISDGVISDIGQGLVADCESIDAGGCLVTPGLVNTHHHIYQSLTRAVPGAQDAARIAARSPWPTARISRSGT